METDKIQVVTKRGRGRPKKVELEARNYNVESIVSGRVKRKSSLGLKKVLMSVRGVRLDSDEEEPEDDVEDKKPSKARRKNTADRHVNTDGKVAHGTPDTKSDISAEKKPNKKRKRNCIEKDTTCETPGETKVFNKLLNPKHEVDSDIDSVEDGEPISAIAKMSGQHKTGLKILTIIPEYKEDLHSVPRDILDDNSKPGGEQKKEGIDQRESNSMSIEEMMDSFSDDDDSSEEKQGTSDAEDKAIQLQLMRQLQEQEAEERELVQNEPPEPVIEKKKYTVPRDTLHFLKNVKKVKKKEKIPVPLKPAESPSGIAKKVLNDIVDEVDGKRHFLITHKQQPMYSISEDVTSLTKFSIIEKRKKGEPSERSVLFKYSQHEEKGWFICPRENCEFRSKHSKNVYTHEKRHNGIYPYMCSLCGKRFILKKNYRIHQDAHQDLRPYQCKECGKWFRNQNNLQRHKLVHSGEKPYQCEVETCNVAFKDKVNLKKHVALVHEGQRPYECTYPGCVYVAYDRHALEKHQIKHKDLQDRPSEKCSICDKVLYGARSMQSHMLLHNGDSHECPFCDYTTVFKQALQAHSMRKHYMDLEGNRVERKYKCKQCDFATFWEHELRFHITKHGAFKPFKCPICEYSTVLKGSLQKHMRLHTGEQPYACNLCGKAYTNQSGLARHKRSHTGEKPHKCDVCGKKYADMKTLRNHRYSHVNLKPFMCPLCNYNCTKKDVLLTHYKRVHGEGNIPDNIRPKPFQRVIMRVTSGQTADEIISNIAPPGKGERQLLVMGGDDSQEEKFLVIHEDEAQALSMIQDNQALQSEALSSESVFRIIQTGDGQTTVDSLSKNLDLLGDDSRKVMKIATAPKNPQREKFFQRIQVTQPQALSSQQTLQTSTQQQQLQIARIPSIEALGSNFVLVPSGDSNMLQTLQLPSKAELIAIPTSQTTISDIVNEALNVQNFGLGATSAVEMNSALESVLQQSKPGSENSDLAGISTTTESGVTEMHITHPILQSQLKREPDDIPLIRNVPVSESTLDSPQGQQNTVFIQVQGIPNAQSIDQDLTSTILHSDLQTDLMVKSEGAPSLTNEIQKLQDNLVVSGSSQLEFVKAASQHMIPNDGEQMDISQHLLGDESTNEKFVLHLPEGHDLNPKEGALEIAGIESGEYVIAYLQNEGHLNGKDGNLNIGDHINLGDRRFTTINPEVQSKLLTSDGQGYFEGQSEGSLSFKSENQDQLNTNSIVTSLSGETSAQTNQENSENQFELNGQTSTSFVINDKLTGNISSDSQRNNGISSLTADQVQIVTENVLQIASGDISTGDSEGAADSKIDIAQLERHISDMSHEMLLNSAQQTTSNPVFCIDPQSQTQNTLT